MSTTTTTHTAGPWNVEKPFQEEGIYIAEPNTGLIAKLFTPDNAAEIGANARLIAAAPELLAALVKCFEHVGHYASMPHASSEAHKDFAQARAAIAKATN